MAKLNPRQQEAVRYLDGPLLVLAGAGSGKTGVITHKIAHLIQQAGISAQHITAVTFTNKAAKEMKARVTGILKGTNTRGLSISTFHTLGLNILRKETGAAGLKSGFSILDEQDVIHLLQELSNRNETDKAALAGARREISHWKNNLVAPTAALSQASDELQLAHAHLYNTYQRMLRAYNAVDFDDLILLPVELLRNQKDILERWQNKIRYLLVDEYQDTNSAQYELVRLLTGVRGALTVVGDDDQSIYAWRGACPENLAELKKDFPQLKVIKLEQNYRSTGRILKAANRLIANNPHVFEKRLWSELGPGDPIQVLSCKTEDHEGEKVVSEILHKKFIQGAGFGDFAILYRGNHQSRVFEKVLRTHNVPYFLSGGTSFFSRTEVKDVMAYLRLLSNPDDNSAFLRTVNIPRRHIGPATLEKLTAYAEQRDLPLLLAIDEMGIEQTVSGKPLARLREFAQWTRQMARKAHEDHPIQAIQQMLKDLDYEYWLQQTSNNDTAAEKRMANVNELVDWLGRLYQDEMQGKSLAEMISQLMLMDILERQDEAEGGDRVHLMTLHAAKGLEFPHVFLVGTEEELLPHRSSIEEDGIEEERRLAYVGITRARKTLTMTYAKKRRRGGEDVACEPSRFLDELPVEDLEWEKEASQIPTEEKKQRGHAHLENLKSMLGQG